MTTPAVQGRHRSKRRRTARNTCLFCLSLLVPIIEASYAITKPRHFHPKSIPLHLLQRQHRSTAASSSVAPVAQTTSSLLPASTSALEDTSTYPIKDPATFIPDWTYPLPFDSVLGVNFTTQTCPSFFATFLNSPSFQACKPLSLLLGTSNGFFAAQKNATTVLPYVIDQSCNVAASCNATMAAYATKLKDQNVCGQDLVKGNALAKTALDGFENYSMYYQLGCSMNSTTGNYCMAEAAASTGSSSSGMYWYLLGQGTALPSGSKASCSGCLENVMQIYSQYATNTSLQISQTYAAARTLTNSNCGVNYAPLVDIKSSAMHLSATSFITLFCVVLITLFNCV